MLVVLEGVPGAAPLETVLDEKPVAEVTFRNLVLERFGTVLLGSPRGRLDEQGAVLLAAYAGIVERVDVDGQSTGMLRQLRAPCHDPVAVA